MSKEEKTVGKKAAEELFGEEAVELEEEEEEDEFEEVESSFANIWMPQESGDVLRGTVKEISEGIYGIYAQIEEERSGELVQTPAHKILQSRIEKLHQGDFVRIAYRGMTKTQGGRNVNNYQVLKRRK